MGREFVETSPYGQHYRLNQDQSRRTLGWIITNGVVLVAEGTSGLIGMLGAAVTPHLVTGELCGSEFFWWVRPDARGTVGVRLLRAAEAWAKTAGATSMLMVAPDERVERLYERLGYSRLEVAYQRRLE